MTMLNVTPGYATTVSTIRSKLGLVLIGARRLMNRWIAGVIAGRIRQADLAILRQLSDRELKDIGLSRGDIPAGLAAAARRRIRKQQTERSRTNEG